MNIPGNDNLSKLIRVGNPAQAELYARIILNVKLKDPHALLTVAWATWFSNMPSYCADMLAQIDRAGHDVQLLGAELAIPEEELQQMLLNIGNPIPKSPSTSDKRYLIIKAWGYGFWSDILQVIGGIMLASLCRRTPVVRWGNNSLYHRKGEADAFCRYFEALPDSLEEVLQDNPSFFPPKWNADNLWHDDVNKSDGTWSRISALDLLGRDETICVLDYFVGVNNLLPYVPPDSELSGMGVVQIHRHLFRKYLNIQPTLRERARREKERLLGDRPYLAVHIRGSDKIREFASIEQMHNDYERLIGDHLSRMPESTSIFLMTDDERVLARYRSQYGERIVCAECMRSSGETGVHYAPDSDIHESALEVIVDTLIASEARRFIGNGLSNPSLIVYYLKQWPEDHVDLLGGDVFHRLNTYLYQSARRR